MRAARFSGCLAVLMALAGSASVLSAAAPDSPEFFESKIRPVLIQRCQECHSASQHKGGLNLDDEVGLRAGGSSGEIVVPGKPDESFLWEVLEHSGDLKMPPKEKLSDQELADFKAWISAGSPWPNSTVSIHLGNVFDDSPETPLLEALHTDAFRADATADDLGIDRIGHDLSSVVEVAPGLKIDFQPLGGTVHSHGDILNDAWGDNGGIRTLGESFPSNAPRTESGIGMHANAFITFDLFELRKAGGIPADQPWKFRVDKMGLNDDTRGNGGAKVHLVVVTGIARPGNTVLHSVHVNGIAVPHTLENGVVKLDATKIPEPLSGTSRFAELTVDLAPEATFVMLAATAGVPEPADNPISSDHAVFSGARLEFETKSSVLAQLGKPRPKAVYQITAEQRAFWSLQPIRKPEIPAVKNTGWPRGDIDRFILAELETRKLEPVGEANRLAWIRRATFDLLGLPPTQAEVQAFVDDQAPDAYDKVIDSLLASPHYGERWGRYWLDLARYGEDQAHTFGARSYPQGYRYRDWIVRSLNDDKPYNQFLIEQLAGDQLESADPLGKVTALGFMALGPVYYQDAGCAAKAAADELDDRVDTLGRGILGLTIACARCHDHKFDPIPQSDYYALAGIFKSTNYREAPLVPQSEVEAYQQGQALIKEETERHKKLREKLSRSQQQELASKADQYLLAVWHWEALRGQSGAPSQKEFLEQRQLVDFHFERWTKALSGRRVNENPRLAGWKTLTDKYSDRPAADRLTPEILAEVQTTATALRDELLAAMAAVEQGEKPDQPKPTEDQKDVFKRFFEGDRALYFIPEDRFEKLLAGPAMDEWKQQTEKLEQTKKSAPPMYAFAHSLADGNAADMPLYQRGNVNQPGDPVPRGFLKILSSETAEPFRQGSGRRQLAEAIASPDNPLTARVMVNRVWAYHFGRGIVGTPSNFGQLGERPTHPALLDYLAATFIADGWSLKRLHRQIMLSATYRLAAAEHALNSETDPENRYLWRMTRRRLDVEAWRDALLTASGQLDAQVGGPSGNLADGNFRRRTFYANVSRHNLNPLLRLFDFPDPNITSERRPVTTVPLQQLFVLNSDFMIQQSRALAKRVLSEPNLSEEDRIRRAIWMTYSRPADADEVAWGAEFVRSPMEPGSQFSPWEQYAQILLSANEMLYVD